MKTYEERLYERGKYMLVLTARQSVVMHAMCEGTLDDIKQSNEFNLIEREIVRNLVLEIKHQLEESCDKIHRTTQ